jgi:hypothetical protein
VAVKSWDGDNEIANMAAVAVLDALGALPDAGRDALEAIARPPQLGGGRVQGVAESRLDLKFE